ncbi:MAG: HlyD family efflux transporter periplasmic adaptor subunit [Gammaproteobacteria bacterium]|nr:HlyD family efflux transporter periplasmic adaptor subunit [Gammaproteobacteria bacterium]
MNAAQKRMLLWAVLGGCILLALVFAFRPQAISVDVHEAARGELIVTVNEEGETRVRDIFVLSAPVAGRMLRIEAEAGDEVKANDTVLAQIEPVDPTFLDFRSEAQARAAVRSAESTTALAQAEVDQAAAELEFARAELKRARELIRDNTISQRALDEADKAEKIARAAYATRLAALQVRKFELESAEAQLLSPAQGNARAEDCECVPITAPVDGVILRVLQESEGVVSAGQPLIEIGDSRDLEIVVDLLSAEAVKVSAGQRVIIEGWGGDTPLQGMVRRVEPFAFTKVSALGIEEQRVNVVIDFSGDPTSWQRLGHGYKVDLRIVLWEGNVIKLPLTALFREGDQWAVFVDDGGTAKLRYLQVGRRNGLEAEITDGLDVGERIILYPGDSVVDGVRVAPRD